MSSIGIVVESDSLVLWTGRDFKWSFDNLDTTGATTAFPSGSLYFELAISTDAGITPTTSWTFSISGSTASITVVAADSDLIPRGTKWQLVFKPTGVTTGGNPIAHGTVKRVPN